MELFKPDLSLIPQGGDNFCLFSVTLTPDSCFSAGPARIELPPGYVVTPETVPVTLELRKRGSVCLPVVTPVRHLLCAIELGSAHGKNRVTAFVVLEGKVLGIASVAPEETIKSLGLGLGCFPTFDWNAWDDKQPPGRALRVTGSVLTPTPCYSATLEPGTVANPPPRQLPLILKIKKTSDACITIPTIIPVRFDDEAYEGGYDTVGIYQGDCEPIVIDIEEVQ